MKKRSPSGLRDWVLSFNAAPKLIMVVLIITMYAAGANATLIGATIQGSIIDIDYNVVSWSDSSADWNSAVHIAPGPWWGKTWS